MDKFLTLAVTGAVAGAIYSMIASGLVLTYAATGVFNLGFGAVTFSSAFLYYELHTGLHWPIAPAAVVTVLGYGPLAGAAFNRLIFRRIAAASEATKIVATVGLLVALPALCLWVVQILVVDVKFGIPLGTNVYLPPGIGPTPPDHYHLGPVSLSSDQLVVFAAAAVVALGLWGMMRRSPLGLRMRAAVDRPELARLQGVNTAATSRSAWMIGTALAALAGVIGSPIFDSLDPGTYTLIMLAATAAAAIGALRSIPLAFAGGLILGVIQDLVTGYASFARQISGFGGAVPFIVLLVALALFGRDRGRAAGSAVAAGVVSMLPDHGVRRRLVVRAVAVAAVVLYLLISNAYWTTTISQGLALSLVFLSFVVVTGMGGMVSLAQPAFVTGAALTAGLVVDREHLPLLVGLVAGVAAAALIGMIVALPALRLGGLHLALATLSLSLVGDGVLFAWSPFIDGNNGWALSSPHLGPLDVSSPRTLGFLLIVLLLLADAGIRRFWLSPPGRAVLAVRSSPSAAATVGVLPAAAKLRVVTCSAGLAGAGGVLLAISSHTAQAGTYVTSTGLVWLAAVVLWGIARPGGAIAAGMTVALLPALLTAGFHWPGWIPSFLSWNGTNSPYIPEVLFGIGAIQLAAAPDGIMQLVPSRMWPRRRSVPSAPPAEAVPAPAEMSAPVVARERGLPEQLIVARPDVCLEIDRVSAGYGAAAVLVDVGLQVRRGTVTALVGANGAGKSTLCRVIGGLIEPSGGRLIFDGADVTGQPAHRRVRSGLALVPESRGIFPGLSVEDNLAIRVPERRMRDAAYERFPRLAERRRTAAGSLSGGEQQMLSLAPALTVPPRLLVVDEPTLGLAPRIAAEIMDVLSDLKERGTTVLVVEEKVQAALDVADDVAFLELGRISWAGPRREVDMERLAAAYLGERAPAQERPDQSSATSSQARPS
jgi:ABC-type branched-subunit amino acid transport system ATPase component/branched-subunit amino acid ABC-type transport system permease component